VRKQWLDGKILITIFSRSETSRHKFALDELEIFSQKCRTYSNPCSYKSLEWIWTLAGEILNFYFVSVIGSDMITKWKITVTVTPKKIFIFNQRFD
jgi:hypothetical protein